MGLRVDAYPNETVLDAAIRGGVGLRSECGGTQVCGKCRIQVRDQRGLTPATPNERKLLNEKIQAGYRLACATRVLPDADPIIVVVPPEGVIRKRQFVGIGSEQRVGLKPAVSKLRVEVIWPGISDRMSDAERLLTMIRRVRGDAQLELDFNGVTRFPEALRRCKAVTVVIWDEKRVISVEAGDTCESLYGLAIDVGTSRITLSLLDLNSGVRLAHESVENPQISYGEDILTRVTYSQAGGDNGKHLQHTIVAGINELTEKVCAEANVSPLSVYEAVIVGNTVMHHLALGLDTKYLARSPFTPVIRESVSVRGAELGLSVNPDAIAHFLPIVDAFVGGDAVGDILSSGLHRRGAPTLLLDIGTNTEVFLRDREGLACCSCASGPAFEGVHIENGIKAVEGALASIKIGVGGFEVEYSVLGGVEPVGLCGSAIIDVVAELFKRGLIDGFGRFSSKAETPRLTKIDGVKRFVLVDAGESGTGRDIMVSERDINEVMLAKAAIYTGCSILMRRRRVARGELSRILIAGGFGKNLNRMNVRLIGLIPDVPSSKISFIGNAAHAGAEAALRSRKVMHLADRVAREAEYIELAACEEFSEEFTAALMLPHRKLELFETVNKLGDMRPKL